MASGLDKMRLSLQNALSLVIKDFVSDTDSESELYSLQSNTVMEGGIARVRVDLFV